MFVGASERKKANSVPVIIEQTAAEQKTSCRLSDPNTEILRVLAT